MQKKGNNDLQLSVQEEAQSPRGSRGSMIRSLKSVQKCCAILGEGRNLLFWAPFAMASSKQK